MMIPNDSMSSRTVTRMKRTAARRGWVTVEVSVIAGASYQAGASNCRAKFTRPCSRWHTHDALRRVKEVCYPLIDEGSTPHDPWLLRCICLPVARCCCSLCDADVP